MRGLLHKTIIIVLLPVLCAVAGVTRPASADETADVGDFLACRAIKGKAERLLCYDTIADGGVFDEERLEQVQRESFGGKQKTPESSIDQLGVTIVRVQKDVNGIRYFQTADGQVWKQQDSGHYASKVPFEAEIKPGMMGSFFLVNEGRRTIRVKRVK
jgi:hypothetical protein